jgi:hypothetical protein
VREREREREMNRSYNGRSGRGEPWTLLPEIKSRDFGKLGPAFGFGIGCGAGFGFGLIGGMCVFSVFPHWYCT